MSLVRALARQDVAGAISGPIVDDEDLFFDARPARQPVPGSSISCSVSCSLYTGMMMDSFTVLPPYLASILAIIAHS